MNLCRKQAYNFGPEWRVCGLRNRKTETVVSITKRKLFVVFSYNTDMKENEKKKQSFTYILIYFRWLLRKLKRPEERKLGRSSYQMYSMYKKVFLKKSFNFNFLLCTYIKTSVFSGPHHWYKSSACNVCINSFSMYLDIKTTLYTLRQAFNLMKSYLLRQI